MRSIPFRLSLLAVALWFAPLAPAQITNVTNSTSTPIPGAPHDYIGMLNETVNPSNGSVSARINISTPSGRQLSLPFSLAYDSNSWSVGASTNKGAGQWNPNKNLFSSQWGWSYSLPQLSRFMITYSDPNPGTHGYCHVSTGFLFQDPSGGRHSLGLSHILNDSNSQQCIDAVNSLNWFEQDTGGDPLFQAALLAPTQAAGGSASVGSDGDPRIVDADGTVFDFGGAFSSTCQVGAFGTVAGMPVSIEDRNGNKISQAVTNCNQLSVTDTLGRGLLSTSAFAQNVAANVVTAIMLPNGRQYQFTYDPTYGYLTKITYPTGGYISYAWGINSQSALASYPNSQGNPICEYRFDVPAVLHRYVSFDGQTVALQQDFSYSTTWSSTQLDAWTNKQTTVTTHDLIRGVTFQTIYSYGPLSAPTTPDINTYDVQNQIPVENTVTYKDPNGNILRTMTNSWFDQYRLACENQTLDNGAISGTFYTYGPGAQVTDKKEYDFGLIASACQQPVIHP